MVNKKNTDAQTMRITGGKFSGRRLTIPQGDLEIRPLMDRMRESLFSIIGPLSDMEFLDLFSGSGVAGIEAASRGAKKVDLVELDGAKRAVIEKNISIVQSTAEVRLYIQDAFEFMERTHNTYDLVYADPPFPLTDKQRIALYALKNGLLKPNSRFVIHIPAVELSLWQEEIVIDAYDGTQEQRNAARIGREKLTNYSTQVQCNVARIWQEEVAIDAYDGTQEQRSAARVGENEISRAVIDAATTLKLIRYDERTYGRNSFLFYRIAN